MTNRCASCTHERDDHRQESGKSGYPCFHDEVKDSDSFIREWVFCQCANFVSVEYASATRSLRAT